MPSFPDSSISVSVVGRTQGDLGDTRQLCVYFNMLGKKNQTYTFTQI